MTHGGELKLYADQVASDLALPNSEAYWSLSPGQDFIRHACKSTRNEVNTSTAVVRTAAQKAVGGYRHELATLKCGCGLPRLAMSRKRLHVKESSACTVPTCRLHSSARQLPTMAAFNSFFRNEGGQVAGRDELWALSRTRLAERFFLLGVKELRATHSLQALKLAGMAVMNRPSIIMPTRRRLS